MGNKGNPNWKPGVSGNPNGRPRVGNSLAECMRVYLEGKEEGDERARKQVLVENLYKSATGDNPVPAARLILETLGLLDIESRLNALENGLAKLEGSDIGTSDAA